MNLKQKYFQDDLIIYLLNKKLDLSITLIVFDEIIVKLYCRIEKQNKHKFIYGMNTQIFCID